MAGHVPVVSQKRHGSEHHARDNLGHHGHDGQADDNPGSALVGLLVV